MSTAKLKTMAECIEDGIRLLDAKRPGWLSKIDLGRFRIMEDCHCVLGQVEGTYDQGILGLGLMDGIDEDADFFADDRVSVPRGFYPCHDLLSEMLQVEPFDGDQLQDAWVARLIALKAERGVS